MRSGARSPAGRSSLATATSRSSATPNISTRRRRRRTAEALDAAVVEMVRGWAPAVEAELIDAAGAPRATRLALTYINSFPDGYRARTAPEEGAADILRLCELDGRERSRGPHLARLPRCARPAAAEDVSPRRPHSAVRRGSGAREFRLPRPRGIPDRARRRHRLYPRFPRRDRRRGGHRLDPRIARPKSSARSPTCCAGRRRTTSSTSSCFTPVSTRRRWCGCAPGSATCARREAASGWSPSSMRCAARPTPRAR